ncbi:MAG: ubiquinol oxidase subunit II [Pseudomonadota bacterium]
MTKSTTYTLRNWTVTRQSTMQSTMASLVRILVLSASAALLGGCDYVLFDPRGPVAEEQTWLLWFSAAVMLVVVIPVLAMSLYFPYKYRASNTQAEYQPDWEHSNRIEAVVWGVPIAIILVLGYITYVTSYSLDPRKPIDSDKETMVVQVVAMDWKWLFIYPELGIASVNEMAMPLDTPVEFLVTSDTAMNSFFIPHLGTQIYAMSGMENRVNLMATEAGTYPGMSANYSGFGFSGMKFNAIATDQQGFEDWILRVQREGTSLDDPAFSQLQEKSRDVAPMYFSSVNPLLFNNVIERFTGGFGGN